MIACWYAIELTDEAGVSTGFDQMSGSDKSRKKQQQRATTNNE